MLIDLTFSEKLTVKVKPHLDSLIIRHLSNSDSVNMNSCIIVFYGTFMIYSLFLEMLEIFFQSDGR